jgi:hypothetical protein
MVNVQLNSPSSIVQLHLVYDNFSGHLGVNIELFDVKSKRNYVSGFSFSAHFP